VESDARRIDQLVTDTIRLLGGCRPDLQAASSDRGTYTRLKLAQENLTRAIRLAHAVVEEHSGRPRGRPVDPVKLERTRRILDITFEQEAGLTTPSEWP
jgi:hypothetical protein